MRTLTLKFLFAALSVLVACSLANAQDSAPPKVAPLHVKQAAPREDAVLFVSPAIGGEGFSFFKAPDGTAALIPIPEVRQALEAGYKPVTVGDILDVTDNYVKTIQDQQKRFNDLAADCNALVERFNRLAAINTAPTPLATSYAPSQGNDEKRAMRLMLFQSLLSRTGPPPPPVQIQVTDCRTYPALCVH